MYVLFLGTGNALPSIDRANTSLAVVAQPGANVVLVDCGGDPYRNLARAGIGPSRVSDLIITHAHIDHIGGLPSLIESFRIAGRTETLRIHANAHALQVMQGLLATFAFELTLDRWPFAIEQHELILGHPEQIGDFAVLPLQTEHTVPSMGLRFTPGSGQHGDVLAYTSDTRFVPELAEIARDATLFIAEATYPGGKAAEAQVVGHLTVSQAATVASSAHARALGLVHLSIPHALERDAHREVRQTFRGETILPHDGLVAQIDGGRVRRLAQGKSRLS